MKPSKILLETVLPITIAAALPIGYFFVSQNLFPEPKLEACESCHISSIVYLIYLFVIVVFCSLYQIILGKWIIKRNENSFTLNVINSMAFAIFFTGILVVINLFEKERKTEWDFFPVIFLVIFLFGLFFSALIKLCRKIWRHRDAN